MGLDMYLKKRARYYKRGDGTYSQSFEDYSSDDRTGRSNTVTMETDLAYWRKANMIHGWFVSKYADGKDECQDIEVDIEGLKELRDICKDILAKAEGWELTVPEDQVEEFRKECADIPLTVKYGDIVKDNLSDYYYHILPQDAIDYCSERLPVSEGFFFGCYEYNAMYLEDLRDTVVKLDMSIDELEQDEKDGISSYPIYRASW